MNEISTQELEALLDEDPGDVEYDMFSEEDPYNEDDYDYLFKMRFESEN